MATHKRGNDFHEVTARLMGISESALGKLDNAVDSIDKRRKKYSQRVEKYVHGHPTKSILYAFLAGFGLAIFLRGLSK